MWPVGKHEDDESIMAVTTWPTVLSEEATITKLHEGYSLARYGDAELSMMQGKDSFHEPANPALAAELRQILLEPATQCLRGIPTMDPRGPKYAGWMTRREVFAAFLSPDGPYGSAFVSREDAAPWIGTPAYAEYVRAVWHNKKVALVCEPNNVLWLSIAYRARKVVYVPCPYRETFGALPAIERDVLHCRPDCVVLACGAAATVLAHRLTQRGIQALDLGSIGPLLARYLPERLMGASLVTLRHPVCCDSRSQRALLQQAGFEVLAMSESIGGDRHG